MRKILHHPDVDMDQADRSYGADEEGKRKEQLSGESFVRHGYSAERLLKWPGGKRTRSRAAWHTRSGAAAQH